MHDHADHRYEAAADTDEGFDNQATEVARVRVLDALDRLVASGALPSAASSNHRLREATRQILHGQPARSLERKWKSLNPHLRMRLADSYMAAIVRPKLGKPFTTGRDASVGLTSTLREAVSLLEKAQRVLEPDQLYLLLASDVYHREYLAPWALPMLACAELGLPRHDTVTATLDEDLAASLKHTADAIGQLLVGDEPGPVADLRPNELFDHPDDSDPDDSDDGDLPDLAMVDDDGVSFSAAGLTGLATMVEHERGEVHAALQQVAEMFADPTAVPIDGLTLLPDGLLEAFDRLTYTVDIAASTAALVEQTDCAVAAPSTVAELVARLTEAAERFTQPSVTTIKLGRLAEVTAISEAARPAAAAFANAARHVLRTHAPHDELDHPLLKIVDVLDQPAGTLDFGQLYSTTIPSLSAALPDALQPHLGMLGSGLLELPSGPEQATAPDGGDTDPTADDEDAPAPVADQQDGAHGVPSDGPVKADKPSDAIISSNGDTTEDRTDGGNGDDGTSGADADVTEEPSDTNAEGDPAESGTDDVQLEGPDDALDEDTDLRDGGPDTAEDQAEDGPADAADDTDTSGTTPADHDTADTATVDVRDDNAVDPAAVDAAVATTVADHRWSAALWIARAGGAPDARVDALELATYAMQLRRLDGPLTASFADVAGRIEQHLDDVMRTPTDRVLTIGSAIRAALITPYTGAAMLSTLAPHINAAPAASAIVDAVQQAAQAGVRFGADAPAFVRAPAATDDDPIAELAEQAAGLLDDAPKQKVVYQAATSVWHDWMRDTGRLGQLLRPIADGDLDQADTLAHIAARTRKSVDGAIATDDRRLRGRPSDRSPIQYTAKMQLLNKADQVLTLVDTWAKTVADQHVTEPQVWEHQRLDVLRDVVERERDKLREEITAACQDDPVACRVAHAVVDELEQMFDRLRDGVPLRGREPDPHIAANLALLKVAGLRLDIDTFAPVDAAALGGGTVAALTDDVSWDDAFAARAAAGDFDETTAIISRIASDEDAGGPDRADELAAQRQEAVEQAHADADAQWKDVERQLENARMHGVLDTRSVSELTGRLQAAKPHAGRIDLGRIGRELERLAIDLDRAAAAAADRLRQELHAAVEHDEHVADHAAAVQDRIDDGDVAVARDLLMRLQQGGSPDEDRPHEPEFNGRFSAALVDRDGATFDRSTVDLIRESGAWGAIHYAALPAAVRERAVKAAAAWVKMASDKGAVTPTNLSAVLAGVGLPVRNAETAIETIKDGSVQHVWRQVTVSGTVTAPVPQYGSDTRGLFRLLITYDGISPSKLVDYAVKQGHRRPVVCLHLGTFTPAQRRELAELCRPDRHNAQVVVIDHVLFGYRLSLSDDQWSATLRLALPYTAVNPYVPDAPELPPEMFFGRKDELGQILDPRGTCVLYGGRKLGKSALLREAARQFDAEGDHAVAVYLDVKNHNIGFGLTATADQLWGVLHQALVDEGVELPDAGPTVDSAREAVSDGLLTWVAADERREVLLLLDECDRLLDVDAVADKVNPFPVVRALYGLAQRSDRRIKPVFAGLHQVQRFQRLPNQPFAHLGRAIAIGGLDEQAAFDLVHQPLTALGCRFASRHVVSRVLAYTNYHPALLQVFGSELVRYVLKRTRDGDPPYLITMGDVEQVMRDERTEKAIRDKFVDTINLDPRYELIAYTLAVHDHERGFGTQVSPAELRELCVQWGPPDAQLLAGDDRSGETFRRLLDEMVDLGVLAPPVNGRYAMRSPTVTQLLGDVDRLLDLLTGLSVTDEVTLDPAHDRRLFPGTTRRAYPLTEQQLDGLVQPADATMLLLSTEALGGNDLDPALTTFADRRDTTLKYYNFAQLARRAAARLPAPKSAVHRLLVCDVRGQTPEKFDHALANAGRLFDTHHPGTVLCAVHVGADKLDVWRTAATGDAIGSQVIPATVLRRWTSDSIRLWAQRAELTVGPGDIDAVVAATGGWPVLLQHAADRIADAGGSLPDAARSVRAELDTPDGAAAFVTQTGLGQLDDAERAAYAQLLLYTDVEPVGRDDLAEAIAEETGAATTARKDAARVSLDVLELLGVLDRTDDGKVVAEPVAAAAWRTVGEQA
jgi:hypothetical protein